MEPSTTTSPSVAKPRMKHDGVTPDAEAPAPAPKSRLVRFRDDTTAEQRLAARPKVNVAGQYRVKAFRIGLPCEDEILKKQDPTIKHAVAHRGDLVFLSHEDALSLLKSGAIETEEAFERRVADESRQAELAAALEDVDVSATL